MSTAWQRIKQVVAALTARIETADRQFVAYHLNVRETGLFWRMNTPDQRHALNVARTVIKWQAAAHKNKTAGDDGAVLTAENRRLLLKAALLHDVGKVKGDVSTADKIIAVLADRFCPRAAWRWCRPGKGYFWDNLKHALYIYYHHAERGAAMLEECGVEDSVVELVRKHHQTPASDDSEELLLLRRADDMN
ncbi:MAG TPA: HDIG domain-containing protein [Patescibacteria group bacterium]|nr:HDIG domain-containing protein [Patescibacteria group bacterium]